MQKSDIEGIEIKLTTKYFTLLCFNGTRIYLASLLFYIYGKHRSTKTFFVYF